MLIRRCLISKPKLCRSFSDISGFISKTDLYLTDKVQISTRKQAHQGFMPSLYTRSALVYDSPFIDRKSISLNNHTLCSNGPEPNVEKINAIQTFVGDKFPLSAKETVSIACGLSNIHLDLGNKDKRKQNSFVHGTLYETDKLRQIGKLVIKFQLDNNTVFAGRRHLSLASTDIESDLKIFASDSTLIPLFMRQNSLLSCVIPYRGTMKLGPFDSKLDYDNMKAHILEKTSVGSFYTLIGLLYTKFDKSVVTDFIDSKVLDGLDGLIEIASQNQSQ